MNWDLIKIKLTKTFDNRKSENSFKLNHCVHDKQLEDVHVPSIQSANNYFREVTFGVNFEL